MCACPLYTIRVLKTQGLPTLAIHEVTRATVLARLLYAAPARWGFSQAQDKDKIERFIAKAVRMGYLPPNNCDFEELVRGADKYMLSMVMHNRHHVLRPPFPPVLERRPGLRSRHHSFKLSLKDDKNFISRILFRSLTNNTH